MDDMNDETYEMFAAVPKKIGNVNTTSLNVRDEPDIENSKIIGRLSLGAEVVIDDETDDWYLLSEPIVGYCMKEYITRRI